MTTGPAPGAARGPAPGPASPPTPAALVVECELDREIPAIEAPRPGMRVLTLVRLFSEPIGMLDRTMATASTSPAELAQMIAAEFGGVIGDRLRTCGVEFSGTLPIDGVIPTVVPPFLSSREPVLRDGPQITAAVCTRDRPEGLGDLLASLRGQEYPRVRVLVVDNAPSDDRTRRLVTELARTEDVEYVLERRPGLSWARNRAVEEAATDVVAWADDDEVCDLHWATEIARGYVEVPQAGAVCGLVVPAELETKSQVWFEQFNGVARGRGFSRVVFSPETALEHSPLYPLPPFGIGGNMSFRRSAIESIGGFDCALGPGTLSMDGDDTAALSMLLLSGGTIVHQPSAIVYHRHRRDYEVLQHLMRGYGRGLGAYYTSMLVRRPSIVLELARLLPRALRDQFTSHGPRLTALSGDFPSELLRCNRIGLLEGPVMYGRARIRARRLATTPSR